MANETALRPATQKGGEPPGRSDTSEPACALCSSKNSPGHCRSFASTRNRSPEGLLRPEATASLLATPRRQKLREHIRRRELSSRQQYANLNRAPLERYTELVQQFSA
ncbi:hypothetical protein HL670_03377 [Serratia plymuthica]|uniref:TraI domain-containing protein n=1 Tax=Serratia plymuthica TaxID=82996 RepID=UPI0015983FD9|nr:hypothetical protein HL670_03377 [Serratia plymuthica]